MRARADRAQIRDEWIEAVIARPDRTETQDDGRIRKWARIDAAGGRYLRVVLLEDGERSTMHSSIGVIVHEDELLR